MEPQEIEYYEKILNRVENIKRSIEITKVLRLDREMTGARYDDLQSLESLAKSENVPCRLRYNCSSCRVERRNRCWADGQKSLTRKRLIKGVPYQKEKLAEMKISHLWMIASHLKVTQIGKNRGALVVAIFRAQQKAEEKKKQLEEVKR